MDGGDVDITLSDLVGRTDATHPWPRFVVEKQAGATLTADNGTQVCVLVGYVQTDNRRDRNDYTDGSLPSARRVHSRAEVARSQREGALWALGTGPVEALGAMRLMRQSVNKSHSDALHTFPERTLPSANDVARDAGNMSRCTSEPSKVGKKKVAHHAAPCQHPSQPSGHAEGSDADSALKFVMEAQRGPAEATIQTEEETAQLEHQVLNIVMGTRQTSESATSVQ